MITVREGKHVCGFCSTRHHTLCPGAVRNGNGDIIQCPCRETIPCGLIRCLDCGWRREEDINHETWTCWDSDDCVGRQHIRTESNPIVIQMRQIQAEQRALRETQEGISEVTEGAPRPNRPRVTPGATRATSGACRCCGEPTRGGQFLPGHDSRYLTRLVEQFKDPVKRAAAEDPSDVRRLAASISPAYLAKFDKRVGMLE